MNVARKNEEARNRIAEENDAFRRSDHDAPMGKVIWSHVIYLRGESFVNACLDQIRSYEFSEEEGDPKNNRNEGVVQVMGETVGWCIELYDEAYSAKSKDPISLTKTHRILSLYFAR